MKTPDTETEIDSRYKIQGRHIIDTEKEINNGEPIYIREILDSVSSEYTSSKISKKDRLDIVGNLGLELLTTMLEGCFKSEDGCNYNAANEVFFAMMDLLGNAYPKLGFCMVENDSKLELVLQLASPCCKYKGVSIPHAHQFVVGKDA